MKNAYKTNVKSRSRSLKYSPFRLFALICWWTIVIGVLTFPFFLAELSYAWYVYFLLLGYTLVYLFPILIFFRCKAIEILSNGIKLYGLYRNPIFLEWEDIESVGVTPGEEGWKMRFVILETTIESDKKNLSQVCVLYRLWAWLRLMEVDGFAIPTYLMDETAEEVEKFLEAQRTGYFKAKLATVRRSKKPSKGM